MSKRQPSRSTDAADAADDVVALEDRAGDVAAGQLVRRGQPGRSGADDDDVARVVAVIGGVASPESAAAVDVSVMGSYLVGRDETACRAGRAGGWESDRGCRPARERGPVQSRAVSVLDTSHVPTPRSSDATASADPVTTRWPLLPIVVTAVAVVRHGRSVRRRHPLVARRGAQRQHRSLPVGDIAEALRHDGHPPLYYLLLHGWMEVFGEGDTAVRALSGVFSVLTLPVAWLVGRRRGGSTVGWLAVIVLAVSPFALRYATETRMYSLVVLLTLLGWLALIAALRRLPATRPGRRWPLVSGALLLTHYWSFWLLGSVGIVLLLSLVAERRAMVERSWRAALAVAAGGIFFLPWVPSFLEQASSTGTPWADPSRPTHRRRHPARPRRRSGTGRGHPVRGPGPCSSCSACSAGDGDHGSTSTCGPGPT